MVGPPALIDMVSGYVPALLKSLLMVVIGFITGYIGDLVHETIRRVVEESTRTDEEALARGRAEQASEAKSAFLLSMNHELRTPLNAILGYAQILLQRPTLDNHQRDGLQIIRDSSEHLRDLIDDVLDMARVEQDKVTLQPRALYLRGLLENVVGVLRARALAKGLELDVVIDEALPDWLKVDEKCLRQVLFNLLGNGLKFTEHGAVKISLACVGEDAEGVQVFFAVEDTGPGIIPAMQKKIFEPFTQTGPEQQRALGMGLGLAISRRLVALMGGERV